MHKIPLPLSTCMRRLALATVATCVLLIGLLPVVWPGRLACMALALAVGLLSWRRYLRRRPQWLRVDVHGVIECESTASGRVTIDAIVPGMIHPRLLSASLRAQGGVTLPLFVPGRSVDADSHWRLRRTLLTWRPSGEGPSPRAAGS